MARPRAVNLASIFVRGIALMGLINAACGSPFPLLAFSPAHLFDGVVFNKKYMQTMHKIGIDILFERNVSMHVVFTFVFC